MVEVVNCIASTPLGSLDEGNGMLQSPECPLISASRFCRNSTKRTDLLVAARSSTLPSGGAK